MTVVDPSAIAGTRVYLHHHLDSRRWDHVRLRDDDIVVTTPYKTGTTWMQRIIVGLIHGPERGFDRGISPWIDSRFMGPIEQVAAAAEAQRHRRVFKSHLALDGTRWDDRVRYVVVGRDTRDTFMSLLNHYAAYTDLAYSMFNETGAPGPPFPRFDGDVRGLWRRWMTEGWFEWEQDGWPFWSHSHHLSTWWSVRGAPNVLLVHFGDLLADPGGEIARLATFLGIGLDEAQLVDLVEASSFRTMKRQALDAAASGDPVSFIFEGGIGRFLNKGTNGRWRDALDEDDLALYERRRDQLDPGVVAWLEGGRHASP